MLMPVLALGLVGSFLGFLKSVLMLLFVLSSLLLMLIVLLQEPKGGGLSSAFGGAGAETFGVQTGSVNKFTAYVAIVFMATALLYAAIRPGDAPTLTDTARTAPSAPEQPEEPPPEGTVGGGTEQGAPAGDTGDQGGK